MEEERQEQNLQNLERKPLLRRFSPAQAPEDPEKRQRIKIWMGACLVIVAGAIDAVEALLTGLAIGVVINSIISVGATFLFWLWFQILGISFVGSPKRLTTMLIQSFGELIPILNTLPVLTLGILILVLLTRAEDSGGIIGKVASAAKGEVSRLSKAT